MTIFTSLLPLELRVSCVPKSDFQQAEDNRWKLVTVRKRSGGADSYVGREVRSLDFKWFVVVLHSGLLRQLSVKGLFAYFKINSSLCDYCFHIMVAGDSETTSAILLLLLFSAINLLFFPLDVSQNDITLCPLSQNKKKAD